jgi:hypothetical protein
MSEAAEFDEALGRGDFGSLVITIQCGKCGRVLSTWSIDDEDGCWECPHCKRWVCSDGWTGPSFEAIEKARITSQARAERVVERYMTDLRKDRMMKATLPRLVLYQTRGTVDGVYPSEERSALITATAETCPDLVEDHVSLAVFFQTGLRFELDVPYADPPEPHSWHWPVRV